MSAEQLFRLAWQADRDGRSTMRDALLTLAVAESGPDEAVLAERCRKQLITKRPDHWFASFPTCGQALANTRVKAAIDRLRSTFPPVRVAHLLLKGDASRGAYTNRNSPLSLLFEDLFPSTDSSAESSDTDPSSDQIRAVPFPGASPSSVTKVEYVDDPAELFVFYLTVLMAIAILLASVQTSVVKDSRAA